MTISAEEGTHRTAARQAILAAITELAPNASPQMLKDLAEAYANVVSPSRGTLQVDVRN